MTTASPASRHSAPETGAATFTSRAFAGLAPCVHCGFCLPACPTYEVTADEADSPRGRIVLLRALARGELPPDDEALVYHLDRCLGCRGCETVCPSGVVYGPALEAARAMIASARPLPPLERLALWLLARPARQRVPWLLSRALRSSGLPQRLAAGAGRDAPRLVGLLAMLAATKPGSGNRGPGTGNRGRGTPDPRSRVPGPGSPVPAPRSHAVLFRGCVMDGLFRHVHDATVTALEANGATVAEAAGQVCCGALAAHAGDHRLARALARENVRALAAARPDATIVVNSAGCGAMLRHYAEYLDDDPLATQARAVAARVRDVSEVLAELGPAPGRPLRLKVAYDAPCHLLHAQKVADAPLALLAAIPHLELVPLEGSERCCGSAGLFALTEPAMSQEVLGLKLAAIRRAAPDVVASGNPGCIMHIGAGALLDGLPVQVRHPVELLAWSYAS